jgi:hypothetical protein
MEFGQTFESSAPVISLTIIDRATLEGRLTSNTTKILVVVRDPRTNASHPNVVSVPTQRIPLSLHLEILGTMPGIRELLNGCSYRIPLVDNGFINGHNPIIYAVESLLASKLGLAESLELGELSFRARLRVVKAGKSYHLSDPTSEQVHYILMANILVVVTDGASLFPRRTASYSQISWVEVSKFIHMVEQKNPEVLGIGLNAIEYCVHGLCISTTYDLLSEALGKDLYEPVK